MDSKHVKLFACSLKIRHILGVTEEVKEKYSAVTQLVHGLATEASLGEEVASNEPVFSKCERKPQSQLVKVCLKENKQEGET